MRQDVSKKTQNNLKKRYQISFRRWIVARGGGGTVEPYVGGDLRVVRGWLSDRMLSGMNWSNYGTVWVIDHIVPLRLFDFTNENDLRVCLHYKNTMPLFKEDNLYKEGAIDFSIRLLEYMPGCEVVDRLLAVLHKENERLEKYLGFHVPSIGMGINE